MKKFLIRAGINPHDYRKPQDLIERDFIGTNSGNLLYAHSIFRNLTTENSQLVADNYSLDINKVKFINENYDGYILALADAFRPSFIWQLKQMTKIIEKLTIPVYLIGVGLRAPYNVVKEDLYFDFDEDVKAFVKAILKKSNIIGVRGNITAQYLNNLGFKQEIDHTVIGCPSMYTFGHNLKITDNRYMDFQSLITTNLSKKASKKVRNFIERIHLKYPNTTFVPQGYDEFKLLYTGVQIFNEKNYPCKLDDTEYKNGKAKFYINAKTWIEDFCKNDLAVGTKLHGNIAATISGVPSISIPLDARMKELVQFHNLTHILPEDIEKYSSINDLLKNVDIHSAEIAQTDNYNHFLKFLDKNNLPYFCQNENNSSRTPYDKLTSNIELYPPITAFNSNDVDSNERIKNIVLGNEKGAKNMHALIAKQRKKLQ